MIYLDEDMRNIYRNMKFSVFGTLYFPLSYGNDLDKEFHNMKMANDLSVIDEVMTEQLLVDLIRIDTDYIGTNKDGHHVYYIKIIPVIFSMSIRHLIYDILIILIFVVSWLKFNHHILSFYEKVIQLFR